MNCRASLTEKNLCFSQLPDDLLSTKPLLLHPVPLFPRTGVRGAGQPIELRRREFGSLEEILPETIIDSPSEKA